MKNILIENNVISSFGTRGIWVFYVAGGIIRGNTINVEPFLQGGGCIGIFMFFCDGLTVTNNNIRLKLDGEFEQVLGIYVLSFDIQSTNLISENNIYKTGPPATNLDVGIGFFGVPPVGSPKNPVIYNTVDHNNVTGFKYGITDGNFGSPDFLKAQCTIFKNNVSNGNGQNYFICPCDPVNSIFKENNIDGCVNPALVPNSGALVASSLFAGLSKEEATAKAREMRSKLFEDFALEK